jgi:dihydroorotate dehydrogenase (NAD+) catalytic subunit
MLVMEPLISPTHLSSFIAELAQRVSGSVLSRELGISDSQLGEYRSGRAEYPRSEMWKLFRVAYQHNFFELLPAHGVPSVSYDIGSQFELEALPLGYEENPPLLPLRVRPTKIGGFNVDFPFGLPASVLAANSAWIEFYARRGFDILTYKTVRTQYRAPHPFPNWVFLTNPEELAAQFESHNYVDKTGFPAKAVGRQGYWPETLATVSMANSFGVPSLAPDWWIADVKKARNVVREGHQVLIVSVIGSKQGNEMAGDLIEAALLAKRAGADIIEANFSCPNVSGDQNGDLYHFPEDAAKISKSIKSEIGDTPLFVKIGYLPEPSLRRFVELNTVVDGIVAINTISAPVVGQGGDQTFPDSETAKRDKAGISGWCIKARAQEVCRNLVSIRKDLCATGRKPLTILGVGGVINRADCSDYLDNIGVDGVESCTGAFLNPYLGLEVRLDEEAIKKPVPAMAFGASVVSNFLKDVFLNPTQPPGLRIDTRTRRVAIERKSK